MSESVKPPIGGGAKKILYTLQTVKRIGLSSSAKALTAKNACKACGLGMGGQQGGMTNEQGDFPAVCNKSVQAQSTDIQSPIPNEVFDHTIDEFHRLSAYEMEHLGRLNTPLFKAKDSNKFKAVDWDWALNYAAQAFSNTAAERSFFYSSGRSSNEAGFILQLLARVYGTNNVNNCSFYCHQATGVGLSETIGVGTATVELDDLDGCDLIFVIGANPASNHPRFIHKLQACRERGGKVVIINPAKEPGLVRFALPKSPKSLIIGGSEIASHYLQPHIGSDLAVFKGIAKAVIQRYGIAKQFIHEYTENYTAFLADIEATSWDSIETLSGLSKRELQDIANVYCHSNNAVFAWGMGITHHKHGVANVEYISNLALLRGMIGKRFSGLLPLRGHSNVQGIGTIGVKPVLAADVLTKMQETLKIDLPSKEASPGMDTLACLEAADRGEMDAALIMGGNLYEATPDSKWAEQMMDKIACKVYLTTTLNKGHLSGLNNGEAIIFPVTARDEEPEPTTQESMFNYVRYSDGGIKRLSNVRSEVDILTDFAQRLFASQTTQAVQSGNNDKHKLPLDFSAFRSHKTIRETIAAIVPGMEELETIDVAKQEFHVRNRLIHKPEFKRANGKAKFVVHDLPEFKHNNQFPMRLMSVRSEGQFNSIIYEQKDSYRQVDQRWAVLINPKAIASLGIDAGDKVNITSAVGEMKAVTVYPFDLPDGDVMAYYPEANVLIGRDRDARSKTPAFKSVDVKLTPCV